MINAFATCLKINIFATKIKSKKKSVREELRISTTHPSHPNSTGQQKTIPTPKALSQLQLSMFWRKFGGK